MFLFSVFEILVPPLAAAYVSGPLPLIISCSFNDGRQMKLSTNLFLQKYWKAKIFGG